MKIYLIIFFYLQFFSSSFGQNQVLVDSISNEICKTLDQSGERNDSIRIARSFDRHLQSFFVKMDAREAKEFENKVFYRLQKKCRLFWEIIKRNSPETDYWEDVPNIPPSKLTTTDYQEFKEISSFIYMEPNGDTVYVSIKNSQWEERFIDHSYSLLKMSWLNNSTFELSFLRSNNEIRKNFSIPGDKYNYYLIEKGNNYYLICVGTPGDKMFSLFKLFY